MSKKLFRLQPPGKAYLCEMLNEYISHLCPSKLSNKEERKHALEQLIEVPLILEKVFHDSEEPEEAQAKVRKLLIARACEQKRDRLDPEDDMLLDKLKKEKILEQAPAKTKKVV